MISSLEVNRQSALIIVGRLNQCRTASYPTATSQILSITHKYHIRTA